MNPRSPRVRVLLDGQPAWGFVDGSTIVTDCGRVLAEADAQYLAPATPTKVIAVHMTYLSRLREFDMAENVPPSYFLKPPSSLNGHRGVIPKPRQGRLLNYEGELACVIGKRMKDVLPDRVLDYVAGFTCANDVGLHDFRHTDYGSMLRVKGQDGFLPLGPVLVSPRDWDPRHYVIRTFLNGKVVQEASSDELTHTFDYLLADISRFITLEPGDVILTGTPANSRPMQAGDVVEVEVSGIGRLTNHVEERPSPNAEIGAQMQLSPDAVQTALGLTEDAYRKVLAENPAYLSSF
jgi:5-oxopent-3-ene-1,2,5-tricarboxylate decarboxylase / 2-hydroxyhepta-2,4-diene-1,7-dioate isomerase